MKKSAITTLAMTVLLASCGTKVGWEKPGATNDSFGQDLAQCKYEAASSARGPSGSTTRRSASGAVGQGIAEGYEQAGREQDLLELCMKARGYAKG